MSEMVERVAQAIEKAGVGFLASYKGMGWADVPNEIFARAAIVAMREPTDAMMRASATRAPTDTSRAHADYQAMIDEALS